jgi:uncharacterized protein with HEPN domain
MLLDTDKNRLFNMLEAAAEALAYARERGRAAHPEIPWRDMVDMRNHLVHAYFDVNLDIVWRTAEGFLPKLIGQLQAITDNDTPN